MVPLIMCSRNKGSCQYVSGACKVTLPLFYGTKTQSLLSVFNAKVGFIKFCNLILTDYILVSLLQILLICYMKYFVLRQFIIKRYYTFRDSLQVESVYYPLSLSESIHYLFNTLWHSSISLFTTKTYYYLEAAILL